MVLQSCDAPESRWHQHRDFSVSCQPWKGGNGQRGKERRKDPASRALQIDTLAQSLDLVLATNCIVLNSVVNNCLPSLGPPSTQGNPAASIIQTNKQASQQASNKSNGSNNKLRYVQQTESPRSPCLLPNCRRDQDCGVGNWPASFLL